MVDTTPIYSSPLMDRVMEAGQDTMPTISTGLDSVRAYQWEMHFGFPKGIDVEISDAGVEGGAIPFPMVLTLAAKQVTAVGFASEPIEVNRVNDKMFYPGKATPEELTVTFDNFYKTNGGVSVALWKWFQHTTYNPMTGGMGNVAGKFKATHATLMHLDSQGQPDYETTLYGVWPISWKTAEFNYGTNEFHTIEVVFRYDFMDHNVGAYG